MIQGLEPDELRDLILSVGTHRGQRRLSPVEVARLFDRALKAGSTPKGLADTVRFSGTTMVHRFLQLLTLDARVSHLVDWGRSDSTVAFTAAAQIARLPAVDHLEVFEGALIHQLSTGEVKELVQLRLRSGRRVDACLTEIRDMRPEVVEHHIFVGAVTSPQSREQLVSMTQLERDALFEVVLMSSLPAADGVSWRLGSERFVIAGDKQMAGRISATYADFEQELNDELDRRLSS